MAKLQMSTFLISLIPVNFILGHILVNGKVLLIVNLNQVPLSYRVKFLRQLFFRSYID